MRIGKQAGAVGRMAAAGGNWRLEGKRQAKERQRSVVPRAQTACLLVQARHPFLRSSYGLSGYPEIAFDTDRFEEIGEHFERERARDIVRGRVGAADVRLFRIRDSVDYAQQWLEDHPLGEEER